MTIPHRAQAIALHPFKPRATLSVLNAYRPNSLPVCASIESGLVGPPQAGSEPIQEPWAYVWASFTPESMDSWQSRVTDSTKDEIPDFVIILQLAGAMKHQTRIFCSAECPRPDESVTEQLDRRKEGGRLVTGAIGRYLEITREVSVLGAIHEYWIREVFNALGMEYVERLTDLWMDTALNDQDAGQATWRGDDGAGGEYFVDQATEKDCQLVRDNRGIKEDIAYYLERRDHTTIIRHRPIAGKDDKEDHAVAWIMTHAAGDQGALHVEPNHRRRGLAKKVVFANLAREREAGRHVRGHVWVQRGNDASEALWKAMGWEKAWAVQWVHLERDDK